MRGRCARAWHRVLPRGRSAGRQGGTACCARRRRPQGADGGGRAQRRAGACVRPRLDGAGERCRRGAQRGGLCLLPRSEEHTSELLSLMRTSYDVFCLQITKTKKKTTKT